MTIPTKQLVSSWQKWVLGVLLFAMFILTAWAWLQVPAGRQIALHWGIDGKADGYGDKTVGLLLVPLVGVSLIGLIWVFARFEPRQQNIIESRTPLAVVQIGLLAFFLFLQFMIVQSALGKSIDVARWLMLATGLLFCLLGNFLGQVRSNFLLGIRTPWTLSSESVWKQTHRVGGRVFFSLGLILAVAALFGLSSPVLFSVLMTGLIFILVTSFGYSYWLWRIEQGQK